MSAAFQYQLRNVYRSGKLLLWRCHGILREGLAITLKAFIHHLAALADLLVTAGDPRLALLDLTIALYQYRMWERRDYSQIQF